VDGRPLPLPLPLLAWLLVAMAGVEGLGAGIERLGEAGVVGVWKEPDDDGGVDLIDWGTVVLSSTLWD